MKYNILFCFQQGGLIIIKYAGTSVTNLATDNARIDSNLTMIAMV